MYAALSASSSLGAQRVGDMSSRNGTSGYLFRAPRCAKRFDGGSERRARRPSDAGDFRDGVGGRRRARRWGARARRGWDANDDDDAMDGWMVMRVACRRRAVGAMTVAYRFGEGRC